MTTTFDTLNPGGLLKVQVLQQNSGGTNRAPNQFKFALLRLGV